MLISTADKIYILLLNDMLNERYFIPNIPTSQHTVAKYSLLGNVMPQMSQFTGAYNFVYNSVYTYTSEATVKANNLLITRV